MFRLVNIISETRITHTGLQSRTGLYLANMSAWGRSSGNRSWISHLGGGGSISLCRWLYVWFIARSLKSLAMQIKRDWSLFFVYFFIILELIPLSSKISAWVVSVFMFIVAILTLVTYWTKIDPLICHLIHLYLGNFLNEFLHSVGIS